MQTTEMPSITLSDGEDEVVIIEEDTDPVEEWNSKVRCMFIQCMCRKTNLEDLIKKYNKTLVEVMKKNIDWCMLREYTLSHIHFLRERYSEKQDYTDGATEYYNLMQDVVAAYAEMEFRGLAKVPKADFLKSQVTVYKMIVHIMWVSNVDNAYEQRELHLLQTAMKIKVPSIVNKQALKILLFNILFRYPFKVTTEALLTARYVMYEHYRKMLRKAHWEKVQAMFLARNSITMDELMTLPMIQNIKIEIKFPDHATFILQANNLVTNIVDKYFACLRKKDIEEEVPEMFEDMIKDGDAEDEEEPEAIDVEMEEERRKQAVILLLDSDSDDDVQASYSLVYPKPRPLPLRRNGRIKKKCSRPPLAKRNTASKKTKPKSDMQDWLREFSTVDQMPDLKDIIASPSTSAGLYEEFNTKRTLVEVRTEPALDVQSCSGTESSVHKIHGSQISDVIKDSSVNRKAGKVNISTRKRKTLEVAKNTFTNGVTQSDKCSKLDPLTRKITSEKETVRKDVNGNEKDSLIDLSELVSPTKKEIPPVPVVLNKVLQSTAETQTIPDSLEADQVEVSKSVQEYQTGNRGKDKIEKPNGICNAELDEQILSNTDEVSEENVLIEVLKPPGDELSKNSNVVNVVSITTVANHTATSADEMEITQDRETVNIEEINDVEPSDKLKTTSSDNKVQNGERVHVVGVESKTIEDSVIDATETFSNHIDLLEQDNMDVSLSPGTEITTNDESESIQDNLSIDGQPVPTLVNQVCQIEDAFETDKIKIIENFPNSVKVSGGKETVEFKKFEAVSEIDSLSAAYENLQLSKKLLSNKNETVNENDNVICQFNKERFNTEQCGLPLVDHKDVETQASDDTYSKEICLDSDNSELDKPSTMIKPAVAVCEVGTDPLPIEELEVDRSVNSIDTTQSNPDISEKSVTENNDTVREVLLRVTLDQYNKHSLEILSVTPNSSDKSLVEDLKFNVILKNGSSSNTEVKENNNTNVDPSVNENNRTLHIEQNKADGSHEKHNEVFRSNESNLNGGFYEMADIAFNSVLDNRNHCTKSLQVMENKKCVENVESASHARWTTAPKVLFGSVASISQSFNNEKCREELQQESLGSSDFRYTSGEEDMDIDGSRPSSGTIYENKFEDFLTSSTPKQLYTPSVTKRAESIDIQNQKLNPRNVKRKNNATEPNPKKRRITPARNKRNRSGTTRGKKRMTPELYCELVAEAVSKEICDDDVSSNHLRNTPKPKVPEIHRSSVSSNFLHHSGHELFQTAYDPWCNDNRTFLNRSNSDQSRTNLTSPDRTSLESDDNLSRIPSVSDIQPMNNIVNVPNNQSLRYLEYNKWPCQSLHNTNSLKPTHMSIEVPASTHLPVCISVNNQSNTYMPVESTHTPHVYASTHICVGTPAQTNPYRHIMPTVAATSLKTQGLKIPQRRPKRRKSNSLAEESPNCLQKYTSVLNNSNCVQEIPNHLPETLNPESIFTDPQCPKVVNKYEGSKEDINQLWKVSEKAANKQHKQARMKACLSDSPASRRKPGSTPSKKVQNVTFEDDVKASSSGTQLGDEEPGMEEHDILSMVDTILGNSAKGKHINIHDDGVSLLCKRDDFKDPSILKTKANVMIRPEDIDRCDIALKRQKQKLKQTTVVTPSEVPDLQSPSLTGTLDTIDYSNNIKLETPFTNCVETQLDSSFSSGDTALNLTIQTPNEESSQNEFTHPLNLIDQNVQETPMDAETPQQCANDRPAQNPVIDATNSSIINNSKLSPTPESQESPFTKENESPSINNIDRFTEQSDLSISLLINKLHRNLPLKKRCKDLMINEMCDNVVTNAATPLMINDICDKDMSYPATTMMSIAELPDPPKRLFRTPAEKKEIPLEMFNCPEPGLGVTGEIRDDRGLSYQAVEYQPYMALQSPYHVHPTLNPYNSGAQYLQHNTTAAAVPCISSNVLYN